MSNSKAVHVLGNPAIQYGRDMVRGICRYMRAFAEWEVFVHPFGMDSLIRHRDAPGFYWEGKPSFGYVQGRPDLWFGRLGAESGVVYYASAAEGMSSGRPVSGSSERLCLGERLRIVPNNAALVVNLHDRAYGVRDGEIESVIPVTGRGAGPAADAEGKGWRRTY